MSPPIPPHASAANPNWDRRYDDFFDCFDPLFQTLLHSLESFVIEAPAKQAQKLRKLLRKALPDADAARIRPLLNRVDEFIGAADANRVQTLQHHVKEYVGDMDAVHVKNLLHYLDDFDGNAVQITTFQQYIGQLKGGVTSVQAQTLPPHLKDLRVDAKAMHMVHDLHTWLRLAGYELGMQSTLARFVSFENRDEQMKRCGDLVSAANVIVKQLAHLQEKLPINESMYAAYLSERGADPDRPGPSRAQQYDDWNNYLTRMQIDTRRLAEVASLSLQALAQQMAEKKQKPKEGARAKSEHNALFTELVVRLRRLVPHLADEKGSTNDLAVAVWNIYFEDDEIGDREAARGILRRHPR